MKQKQVIAIDIEVLRDWHTALINTYIKQIGDWSGNISGIETSDLWKHFNFPQYVEVIKNTDENGHEYDGFVESNIEDSQAEYIPSEKYFNQFITEHVLEIFGHAKEKEINVIHYLNEKQKSEEIDITLYSTVKGKAKPATLFFLSKYGCEVDTVKFVKNVESLIDYDMIITKSLINGKLFKELDFRNL